MSNKPTVTIKMGSKILWDIHISNEASSSDEYEWEEDSGSVSVDDKDLAQISTQERGTKPPPAKRAKFTVASTSGDQGSQSTDQGTFSTKEVLEAEKVMRRKINNRTLWIKREKLILDENHKLRELLKMQIGIGKDHEKEVQKLKVRFRENMKKMKKEVERKAKKDKQLLDIELKTLREEHEQLTKETKEAKESHEKEVKDLYERLERLLEEKKDSEKREFLLQKDLAKAQAVIAEQKYWIKRIQSK